MNIWADRWHNMHRWWSVRIGLAGTLLIAVVPAAHEEWPNFVPALLGLFPNHGQQWVPFAGGCLGIAARVLSQSAVVAALAMMFGRKGKDDVRPPDPSN